MARLRLAELEQSASILKVSDVETLGYHDSGMEEWDYKSRPDAFSNVPLDDGGRADRRADHEVPAAGARHLRRRGRLPAPGRRARQPRRPGRGGGDRDSREGVPVHDEEGVQLAEDLDALRAAGEEVPNWDDELTGGQEALAARSSPRRGSLPRSHPAGSRAQAGGIVRARSQINDSWSSKIPPEIAEQAFGYEYFIRKTDTTGAPLPETDLFAGLRSGA